MSWSIHAQKPTNSKDIDPTRTPNCKLFIHLELRSAPSSTPSEATEGLASKEEVQIEVDRELTGGRTSGL